MYFAVSLGRDRARALQVPFLPWIGCRFRIVPTRSFDMNFVLGYLMTAHLLPTNRVARVVEEPRAGFVSVVVSIFGVGIVSMPFSRASGREVECIL